MWNVRPPVVRSASDRVRESRGEPSATEGGRAPTGGLAGVAGYLRGRRRAALIP